MSCVTRRLIALLSHASDVFHYSVRSWLTSGEHLLQDDLHTAASRCNERVLLLTVPPIIWDYYWPWAVCDPWMESEVKVIVKPLRWASEECAVYKPKIEREQTHWPQSHYALFTAVHRNIMWVKQCPCVCCRRDSSDQVLNHFFTLLKAFLYNALYSNTYLFITNQS